MKIAPAADLETILDAKYENTEKAIAERVVQKLDGQCLRYGASIAGMKTCEILVEYAKFIIDKDNKNATANILQLKKDCLNEIDTRVTHSNYSLLNKVVLFKGFCNEILKQSMNLNQSDSLDETTECRQNLFRMT